MVGMEVFHTTHGRGTVLTSLVETVTDDSPPVEGLQGLEAYKVSVAWYRI